MIKQSILLANLLVAVGIAEGHGLSSAVNIGISSPTLHLNNSGDISVKGTSEVTVTDGVPEDKVNFSIEGNGVLSATSATFNNEGKASVTVTGQHPYSGIINVKATTEYGKRANTSLGISSPDITASNNGAISGKGSSVVTVTDGVPNDKLSFTIEGNGVLSATSAIFDNNGNASVTVTGKHPYSGIINVKATTDYGKRVNTSLGISSPDITASNNGAISVKGTSEVTVANGVPEDKVDFSIEGNGVLSATSAIFDNNGNASVTVTGKHPYSGIINVKATTDYGKRVNTSLGISSPDITILNGGAISGKGSSLVTIKNGVAGDKVTFSSNGDGTLSATSATFDNNGNASVTVTGKHPYSEKINVKATTDYHKEALTSVAISSPNISVSNSGGISGKGNSTITVSNGVAGDKVNFFKSGNGTLSATSATFNNEGKASVTVTGKNPYSGTIGVTAITDYGKTSSTSLGISSPDITASNNGAISVKGSSVVTIKNGVAGDKVTFSSNGDGTLSATSATFDNNGNASVTVTGKHPYSNTINVKATTDYYKEASTSVAISAPAISVSNSGGISGKGNSTITVSNGVAGDKVYFSNSGNGYLSASSATFNSNGQASVTVTGKNPYSGTIGVTATTDYGKTSSTSLGISAPNLSMSSSKSSLTGNESATVTVSGGVAGEICSFGISGSGSLSASSATFNSNGQASVTVTGTSPYNSTIWTSASTNYGKSTSTSIGIAPPIPTEPYVFSVNSWGYYVTTPCSAYFPFIPNPLNLDLSGVSYKSEIKQINFGYWIANAHIQIYINGSLVHDYDCHDQIAHWVSKSFNVNGLSSLQVKFLNPYDGTAMSGANQFKISAVW